MFKFISDLTQGRLYGFGLTEAELNRLEYNLEGIFFDFGYAKYPNLFGLILYLQDCKTPEDIAANVEAAKQLCIPFLNPEKGVTSDNLCFFPLAKSIIKEFRSIPYWGYGSEIKIGHPSDKQLFFAGRTEEEMQQYFQNAGVITPETKRTYKGFGRQ